MQGGAARPRQPAGETIATHMDHRIAMAFLICGLAADGPVRIDDGAMIATSFPGFVALMRGIGAEVTAEDQTA